MVMNHGVPIRKLCSGSSAFVSSQFPTGSVMWKTHESGFWT